MNDEQKQYLQTFWESEGMREAVRKVLLQSFEVLPNHTLSNELIGEQVRGLWAARSMIDAAFKEIETYQKPKKVENKPNQAR